MLDSHKTSARPPRLRLRGVICAAAVAVVSLAALPASAAAIHNAELGVAERLNQPGTTLGTSYTRSDTTLGDPTYNPGEPTQCTAAGTTNFGSSVYYKFHPHRNGRVRLSVQATSGNLEPVVAVLPYNQPGNSSANLGAGVCNGSTPPINRATLPADGYLQTPSFPITAGRGYVIMIGGATVNNLPPFEATEDPMNFDPATEGNYTLSFTYDPDNDGDGLYNSQDRCDNERGTAAFIGCPDTDGDRIANPDDRCPTRNAGADGDRFNGCPDADNDGIPEGATDKCEGISPAAKDRNDKNKDGCPDLLKIKAGLKHLLAPSGGGVLIGPKFQITNVDRGSRVVFKCRRPNRTSCGKLTVRRASTASVRGDVFAHASRNINLLRKLPNTLPYGTRITVRVTACWAIGRVINAKIVRGNLISKKYKRIRAPSTQPARCR
jgi:hypothetical protein